jgi:hypothetical protein
MVFPDTGLSTTFYQGNHDTTISSGISEKQTPYPGAVGMLQQINCKFAMGKLKSSLLS